MYIQYTSPLCALYLRLRLLGRHIGTVRLADGPPSAGGLWCSYCVPERLMYIQYTSPLCALYLRLRLPGRRIGLVRVAVALVSWCRLPAVSGRRGVIAE